MRALIKTKDKMLATPGVSIISKTNKLHYEGSNIASPQRKLDEICGIVVFCYSSPYVNGGWVTKPYDIGWTIESWMIKEVLVE